MRRHVYFGIFILVMTGIFIQSVQAIPAFARKYSVSCVACHSPFPKLTSFGEDFAANGFTMPGPEPTHTVVNTGDETLLLQRTLPLALRLDGFIHFSDRGDSTRRGKDLQTPYILKVFSGGPVSKHVSYYFYFFFSERGEVAGIEDAYLHFNNLFGQPLDILVGQFQVSDPMYKRELRLTFEDYMIYKKRVGAVPTNLTYDRGLLINYTAPWGSDFFLEIVNGNGKEPADEYRQFDNDDYKNYALRWTHEFDWLRLGAFGFWGLTEDVRAKRTNWMEMFGPDATLNVGPLEINMQYLIRRDDNPFYSPRKPAEKIETRGGLVEVIYSPKASQSKWYVIGLYNKITSNIQDVYPEAKSLEYETACVNCTYLLARNLRLTVEYRHDLIHNENRLTLGVVSAF
ncbi:MAG: hypothetical protein GXO78_00730 [Calditrichaeota bacterium]|nr:hypothetical protein [Calditrichota bacterium]